MTYRMLCGASALALTAFAAPVIAQDCAALVGKELGGLAISTAETMAASEATSDAPALPAHCHVVGTIEEGIGVEMLLPEPANWNGKFNGVGNGALGGFINTGAMQAALARGYATASTDTGHVGQPVEGAPPFPGFDASWTLDEAAGELDMQALENFGHRSIHLAAQAAKAVVEAHYSRAPEQSYFTACSGGGQQALSEAQRYPEDYDGIVAGAPANRPMSMWLGEIYPAVLARDVDIPALVSKLPLIEQATLAQCDAADGLEDGLLSDPRTCDFSAATLQCGEGADPASCLSSEEVEVVSRTYEGLKDPTTSEQVWPGFEPSSEGAWEGHLNPFFIQLGYLAYMVHKDPAYDWTTFDFDDPADWQAVQEANAVLAPMLEAANTDLSAFRDVGGKLIMWHGWLDQNIAPRNSIAYAEEASVALGDEAGDTLRLFMVPGMRHCEGGPGFHQFDALAALEAWVEEGTAPLAIEATQPDTGATRPLCPYPQVAQMTGDDPASAASFTCE